jgi:hypothetical protein
VPGLPAPALSQLKLNARRKSRRESHGSQVTEHAMTDIVTDKASRTLTDLDKLFDASKKIGALRGIVFDLLKEHEKAGDDGLPTSARFLFYELVVRRVLQKHLDQQNGGRRADQNLHDALTDLREAGLVPWDWIVDETRSLEDYTGWSSIKDWAVNSVLYIRLDPWRGRAPMVLTESRSLAGVLRKLAKRYAVKIAATNGQVGGFLHTDIVPALSAGDRVLYAGDWDWQGHQIEANTRRVLEREVGELDWKRIALTERQVKRHRLKRFEIMKPDRRYKPVQLHPAIETEALKQQVIVQIVRDALNAELPEPLDRVLEREQRQRDQLIKVLR